MGDPSDLAITKSSSSSFAIVISPLTKSRQETLPDVGFLNRTTGFISSGIVGKFFPGSGRHLPSYFGFKPAFICVSRSISNSSLDE